MVLVVDGDGFDSSPSHFTDEHFQPEAITNDFPIQVTLTAHPFKTGYALRFTQFQNWPPYMNTGMEQLNNKLYYVVSPTPNTFKLADKDGNYIDGRSYTAFTGSGTPQITLTGPNLFVQNPAPPPPP